MEITLYKKVVMSKVTLFFTFMLVMWALPFTLTFAQGMMNVGDTSIESRDNHTAREENEGKEVWEKLQSGERNCDDLTDDDYGVLGEYFMGQMMGDSHEAMNEMMITMLGEEGEEEMHVVMGKRLSGCDTDAAIPTAGMGFTPMMMGGGMMGNFSNPSAFNSSNNIPMMNFGYAPFGGFGLILMILFWGLVIYGVYALIKSVSGSRDSDSRVKKSPLDILKERYARGEIDKEEFEEKKRDLT